LTINTTHVDTTARRQRAVDIENINKLYTYMSMPLIKRSISLDSDTGKKCQPRTGFSVEIWCVS